MLNSPASSLTYELGDLQKLTSLGLCEVGWSSLLLLPREVIRIKSANSSQSTHMESGRQERCSAMDLLFSFPLPPCFTAKIGNRYLGEQQIDSGLSLAITTLTSTSSLILLRSATRI